MPRPLSATVIVLPSACSVTTMFDGVAVHHLVDGVVDDLPEQVVQPGLVDAADVHAGPPADGLQALEDGDVFGGVSSHAQVSMVLGFLVLGSGSRFSF